MKKITYFLVLLLAISACKYDDNPYSFTREFDSGTYITPDGKVKFISGRKDSLLYATDKFAVIQENITYVKKTSEDNNILSDSILIYGHVYSRNPNPEVCGYDSVSKIKILERLENIKANYFYNGVDKPKEFITNEDLSAGTVFESSFGLQYEKDYYVRSFIVTGYFDGDKPIYKDIAYNQNELKFTTGEPNDLWVGAGMEDAPSTFIGPNIYWGATSFTYDGYMFVAQGHSDSGLGNEISIYRYDPVKNSWDETAYPSYSLDQSHEVPFTNPICFVIENVKISNGNYHDCLYIGLGASGQNLNEGNVEFYRLILDASVPNQWKNITTGNGTNPFPGIGVENAVAFSINGIGYVGLGTIPSTGEVVEDFYSYDPNYDVHNDIYNPFGQWKPIGKFPDNTFPQKRTEAVVFKIGDKVYLGGGRDNSNIYYKDLWRCIQTDTKGLRWIDRTSMPDEADARCEAVGFSLGLSGYIGLGKNAAGDALRDFWRYDPLTNSWDRRADFGMVDHDTNPVDDIHDWIADGKARYEAVGVGIRISDNDYRAYIGTGWAGGTGEALKGFNDFWHYRP